MNINSSKIEKPQDDPRIDELALKGVPINRIHEIIADMPEGISVEEYLCRAFLLTDMGFYSWMTDEILAKYRKSNGR